MKLVPKREYIILLIGDIGVFIASLWLTLLVRYQMLPDSALFNQHLIPFSLLFIIWIIVFFIAGLYGRHTRLFRYRLATLILYTQTINVIIAALFFFFVPLFGIAPKTNLLLYLPISFALIFIWRVMMFPRLHRGRRLRGVLIASGADVESLIEDVENDERYPFRFEHFIDTAHAPAHVVIQQACRVAAEKSVSFLVVDFSNASVTSALPIIYDAAFQKHRFALVDVVDLHQEIFHRVPLSLLRYEWILQHVSSSRLYDIVKRVIDFCAACIMGAVSLIVYPFVMLAIKLDDGGDIFITQRRVGKFQRPIDIIKFRSMSGNDEGIYGEGGTSTLHVTRVGRWLRLLRIDELPQLWNVLKGDLSLVGPRPELPALASQYSARIPYYNARYFVTPGLTGWAQVKHDRDPHHGADIAETKMKLSYDLYYLKHRSLILDLYIILQTIRIVLTARGT